MAATPSQQTTHKLRQTGAILLILLVAAALRLVALPDAPPDMTGVPPGMTHDEADHGLTAWQIVNGARALYFAVGYGREPLYDYATALLMAGTGPTILAARLTSVYFSLLMVAAVYAWARLAFGAPTALLAAAGLAVGFWPVMAGRQALRSVTLPALFALAVVLFWRGLFAEQVSRGAEGQREKRARLVPFSPASLLFFAAGLLLGLTFYTYIPARVLWLAFPALALYLLIVNRRSGVEPHPYRTPDARRVLTGLALTLLVAGLVAAPLFLYLASNPGLEVRIAELSAPLRAAAGGDFAPLWANTRGALRLFTVEGDQTWRYNLPGKPWLGPVMGALFYVGLLVAGWLAATRSRVFQSERPFDKLGFYKATAAPAAFLSLVWLALGISPVLVTGPGLSTTQAIGALPVLYIFPALALVSGYNALMMKTANRRPPTEKNSTPRRKDAKMQGGSSSFAPWRPSVLALNSGGGWWSAVGSLLALALFSVITAQTARDYFGRWASAPEVRVQYETAMVTALGYLDQNGGGDAVVSTITPGRYHTPAVALLTLHNPTVTPRWFDGRHSLLLPDAPGATLVVPGFTPIPAALQPYLADATLIDELPLRPDDLDRPVRVYRLTRSGRDVVQTLPPIMVDGIASSFAFPDYMGFIGYDLSATAARPGDTLALVTAWRLEQPLPDAMLFAHLVGPDGRPVAQADGLGAPGESWHDGDFLLQLHTLTLPPDTPAGEYPLVVGLYTTADGQRLASDDGSMTHQLTTVTVGDG